MNEELRDRLAKIRATGVDPAGQVFIERTFPAFTDENHAAKDLYAKLSASQNNSAALHVERGSLLTEIGFFRLEIESLHKQLQRATIDLEGSRVALSVTVAQFNEATKQRDDFEGQIADYDRVNAEVIKMVDAMRATSIPALRPWANRIEAVVLDLTDGSEGA